jgi:hypothetical protein
MSNLTHYQQVESADAALIADTGDQRIYLLMEHNFTLTMYDQGRDRLVIKIGSDHRELNSTVIVISRR